MNERVSFGSIGRLVGRLLFCGLVAFAVWAVLGLIGLEVPQGIARIVGLVIGWPLFGIVFKQKPVLSADPQTLKP
jgi:uncharacterized membrane protein AbrB (regulator of aidB expression)